MCLTVICTGDEWRAKNPNVKTFTVYKVLGVNSNGKIVTPFRHYPVDPGTVLRPEYTLFEQVYPGAMLDGGVIHAYAKIHTARYMASYNDTNLELFIVECTVPAEDIVAFGHWSEIALRQLQIPPLHKMDIPNLSWWDRLKRWIKCVLM